MTAPSTLPHPRANITRAGLRSRISSIGSADILVAVGDFTGGASENLFTLTAHGLSTGDVIHVLWQSVMGGAAGGEGARYLAKVLSSSTFQLTSDGTTVITNTADATVVFLKGDVPTAVVTVGVIPNLIVDAWDFTGGTVEDMGTPAQGTKGLFEADPLKLLYKSAAGVTAGTLDVTYYAKAPTVTYHQIAATAGGAVIDSTADGTAVFLKIA